jgi:hypothetical protein
MVPAVAAKAVGGTVAPKMARLTVQLSPTLVRLGDGAVGVRTGAMARFAATGA